MQESITERISELIASLGENVNSFSNKIGVTQSTIATAIKRNNGVNSDMLEKIIIAYPLISLDWLIRGEGSIFKIELNKEKKISEMPRLVETRPRIPLNAAAGTLSVALSGVSADDCDSLPFIDAFSNYNYTILVKGDSMEPEFHSGDEIACLQLTNGKANFIQWGRYHVLDTAQGILLKRIYDKGDYILCKSDNGELYEDFKIHKEEVYNLGLVIGLLRRY